MEFITNTSYLKSGDQIIKKVTALLNRHEADMINLTEEQIAKLQFAQRNIRPEFKYNLDYQTCIDLGF